MIKNKKAFIVGGVVILCAVAFTVFMILRSSPSLASAKTDSKSSLKTASMESANNTNVYTAQDALSVETSNIVDADTADKFYKTMTSIDRKSGKVLATVNGEPIYAVDVVDAKARVELSINSYLKSNEGLGSEERQAFINQYSKTDDQILEELIRDKVLLQNALKAKLDIPEDEILQQAKQEVSLMKDDELFYNTSLKAYGMTEDEYMNDYYLPNVRNRYLRNAFKDQFFKSNDGAEQSDYEKYIDKLVDQAEIIYK